MLLRLHASPGSHTGLKFVAYAGEVECAPAPRGDASVLHSELLDRLELRLRAPIVARNAVLGWIWRESAETLGYATAFGARLPERTKQKLLHCADQLL